MGTATVSREALRGLAGLLLELARLDQEDAEDEAWHARMRLDLAWLDLVGAVRVAGRNQEPLDQPHLWQLARRVLDLAAACPGVVP
jgi:hypothetical protein